MTYADIHITPCPYSSLIRPSSSLVAPWSPPGLRRYPQNCSIDVLKLYIMAGEAKAVVAREQKEITSQITGAVDWRGKNIRYRKNECFIDVLESVNLLMSSDGNVLRNDVTGQVLMKTYLTGMPECKFGLNDKLVMDRDPGASGGGRKKTAGVRHDRA